MTTILQALGDFLVKTRLLNTLPLSITKLTRKRTTEARQSC